MPCIMLLQHATRSNVFALGSGRTYRFCVCWALLQEQLQLRDHRLPQARALPLDHQRQQHRGLALQSPCRPGLAHCRLVAQHLSAPASLQVPPIAMGRRADASVLERARTLCDHVEGELGQLGVLVVAELAPSRADLRATC